MKLVIIRHGESEWNKLNLFTGWKDVDLSPQGHSEAVEAGLLLKLNNFDFDICYTSYLKRAIHTLNQVLEQMDREWLPVIKTWKLNERHYGALQGLNKSETAQKYGEEQVNIWRRSFDVRPLKLSETDEQNPQNQPQYRDVSKNLLPLCESLKDTIERVIPYFNDVIKKDMEDGKNVLIVAHGNSIRSLVKFFDKLSEEKIMEVNIPTGIPLVYEFDLNFNVVKKYYLGDQDAMKAQMDLVAKQGKAN